MIPANKKKNFTELPESLSNQIQSTFQSEEEKNVTVFIKPDHNEENNKRIIEEEIKTVTNSTENEICRFDQFRGNCRHMRSEKWRNPQGA